MGYSVMSNKIWCLPFSKITMKININFLMKAASHNYSSSDNLGLWAMEISINVKWFFYKLPDHPFSRNKTDSYKINNNILLRHGLFPFHFLIFSLIMSSLRYTSINMVFADNTLSIINFDYIRMNIQYHQVRFHWENFQ